MADHLYLWGAMCREVQRDAAILDMRGYEVRTLQNECDRYGFVAGPREVMRVRAVGMMSAAAVVIDADMPADERRQALQQCHAMGVRAVYLHELPATCPDQPAHLIELLDSMDRSNTYSLLPPPERMAVPPASITRTIAARIRHLFTH